MAKKKDKTSEYQYVDAWYSNQNGRSIPWKRIPSSEVKQFQTGEAFNFNCFATVQRFANDTKVKGEAFIAPLYFDLDHAEDPSVSQKDAVKLVEFFTKEMDIRESDMWIYFSGSKGFHILISSDALGIEPRNDLHKIFKHMAGYLVHRLGLTSLDLVVYTEKRMIRLPNSMHQKTNLFKTEISVDELNKLTLEEIKDLAKSPRHPDDLPFTAEERKKGYEI